MMPILHSSGVMTPGQFGPIRRSCEPDSARLTRTMSSTGMPSVMQTIERDAGVDGLQDGVGGERRRHVDGGGVGAGLGRASATVSNTGRSRCVVPPLPGVTPPTTLVP